MKKLNPFKIVLFWLVGSAVITLLIMIVLGLTTPGGEQKPLIFFSKAVYVIIYGVLSLSILSIPFFSKWSKKYWFVHVLLVFFCCLLIFLGHKNTVESTSYAESSSDIIIGKKKYTKNIEYYDESLKIRSISFMYNNRKDSVWTVYSEDGNIISQIRYREDSVIEVLKK